MPDVSLDVRLVVNKEICGLCMRGHLIISVLLLLNIAMTHLLSSGRVYLSGPPRSPDLYPLDY